MASEASAPSVMVTSVIRTSRMSVVSSSGSVTRRAEASIAGSPASPSAAIDSMAHTTTG